MASVYQAQDTFMAYLADGSLRFVRKGETFGAGDELVKRDLDSAEPGRAPLFAKLELDDGEAEGAQPSESRQRSTRSRQESGK